MQSIPSQAYKPKDNHPWRRYKNKPQEESIETVTKPSLRTFLLNLATNYDDYKVDVDELVEGNYQSIKGMPDSKVAEWLVSFVKRNWISSSKEAIVIE